MPAFSGLFAPYWRADARDHPNDGDLWTLRVADRELVKITFREGICFALVLAMHLLFVCFPIILLLFAPLWLF